VVFLPFIKSAKDSSGNALPEDGTLVMLRREDISGYGTSRYGRELYLSGGQYIMVQDDEVTIQAQLGCLYSSES
jgi:hypothetical protein